MEICRNKRRTYVAPHVERTLLDLVHPNAFNSKLMSCICSLVLVSVLWDSSLGKVDVIGSLDLTHYTGIPKTTRLVVQQPSPHPPPPRPGPLIWALRTF